LRPSCFRGPVGYSSQGKRFNTKAFLNTPLTNRTLKKAALPPRVLALCEGVLALCAEFFDRRMAAMLDNFQDELSKEAEPSLHQDNPMGHYSGIRTLARTRHDLTPAFLATLERRLSRVRRNPLQEAMNKGVPDTAEMRLVDEASIDKDHVLADISARCESQNNFEIFLLGQRFGVLSGTPGLESAQLPIGPQQLCSSFDEALLALELDMRHSLQVCHLFEQYVLNDFAQLLEACNGYLIAQGVLPNLTYVPFRNPELRHRASPMALNVRGGRSPDAVSAEVPGVTTLRAANDENALEGETLEENFHKLQQLMGRRRHLLNKLNAYADDYLENVINAGSKSFVPVDPEALDTVLVDFQSQLKDRSDNANRSIQHIKHDLLAQLHNLSSEDRALRLAPEDNDAIDLIGLLMDQMLKDVNPASAGSQLLHQIQLPLIRLVLQDKTFFSNRSHPARKLLDILADAGFNWLDQPDTEDQLQERINGILSQTLLNTTIDGQNLVQAYDDTQQLLQAIVDKAGSIERRQIEAAKGKERLKAARLRAENTLRELMSEQTLDEQTAQLLAKSWADVLTLTELRSGTESEQWHNKKSLVEKIIALQNPADNAERGLPDPELHDNVADSLAMVGFHAQEAQTATDRLLGLSTDNSLISAMDLASKMPLGGAAEDTDLDTPELTQAQQLLLQEILALPMGTWFEMIVPGSTKPVRRKLAWLSEITQTVLFVNQRGYKTSELTLNALALEISEGRARREPEHRRSLFERAFASVMSSLRSLMPSKQGPTDV